MSFRGLGFRVQGLGFRVQGLGFRVQGLGFRELFSGCSVKEEAASLILLLSLQKSAQGVYGS